MKVPNTKWRIRRDSDWTTESQDYFFGKRCLVVSLGSTPTYEVATSKFRAII